MAQAGNRGDEVRSDCHVTLELTTSGGIQLEVNSKVGALYGRQITDLCHQVLTHFGVVNCRMMMEDKGALPFVMAARIEACVRQLMDVAIPFLLPLEEDNAQSSAKDRIRRSRLYLPGNNPKLMINAGIYAADGVILDLEDSVAPDKKDEARLLVRNALRTLSFNGAERMVRINQLPLGLLDLEALVPGPVELLLLPKCESASDVLKVEARLIELLDTDEHNIRLMPIIESALGVVNAYEIASASDHVVALAIGLEDYTADLGAPRTNEATESFYARTAVVNAARAAGKQAIDSVFSDVGDMEALRQTVATSKALGFSGMGCIHPRQISFINEGYAPDNTEIDKAKRIVEAFHTALKNGSGVVALGSKMIDPPVVKRAQKVIEVAVLTGKLANDWRTVHE